MELVNSLVFDKLLFLFFYYYYYLFQDYLHLYMYDKSKYVNIADDWR